MYKEVIKELGNMTNGDSSEDVKFYEDCINKNFKSEGHLEPYFAFEDDQE